MKLDLFSDKTFYKKLAHISLPIALQSLMLALVAASDAFMLGHGDQNAMTAVSLATQIQFVQNLFLGGIIFTTTILGAQYWGKKDHASLNYLFSLGLKFAFFVSLCFFIACRFFPELLMHIFTNEPVLIEIGIQYLKIASYSYLLTGLSQIILVILKVTDYAHTVAIISSLTVVLNIILNALLIFGLLGLPELGAQGAATATLIARIIELISCLAVFYHLNKTRFSPTDLLRRHSLLLQDFIKCMLPLLGAHLVWGIGFTSYTAFMGHLGKDPAAANSIASVVRDLVCCLCNGLATGAGIVVGNELGAGQLEKGKCYGDRLFIIAIICGLVSTLLMLISTPIVLHYITLTPDAQKALKGMMLIMSFYMIGRAINSILINGIFDCGGDTLFDMYSLAVTMWGIAVPLAFLGTFVFHWPALIVYACTCLDEVGKIPWVIVHYRKYKWVKDLTR
ncbi:MAG: MATE family efflux transporter [Treponema sp.]|nr:MATE family efflux transporter [Treponema sp.]